MHNRPPLRLDPLQRRLRSSRRERNPLVLWRHRRQQAQAPLILSRHRRQQSPETPRLGRRSSSNRRDGLGQHRQRLHRHPSLYNLHLPNRRRGRRRERRPLGKRPQRLDELPLVLRVGVRRGGVVVIQTAGVLPQRRGPQCRRRPAPSPAHLPDRGRGEVDRRSGGVVAAAPLTAAPSVLNVLRDGDDLEAAPEADGGDGGEGEEHAQRDGEAPDGLDGVAGALVGADPDEVVEGGGGARVGDDGGHEGGGAAGGGEGGAVEVGEGLAEGAGDDDDGDEEGGVERRGEEEREEGVVVEDVGDYDVESCDAGLWWLC
ncbi:hypothetical protein CGCVW01_v013929 [Colletotrichum viniferum]|nr:hypothetical protein CGCVW01_v013929 [Colletotrichum viniferum]